LCITLVIHQESFEMCRLVNSYRRFEGTWCPYPRN